MSQETAPTQPSPGPGPPRQKQALLEAYHTVLKHQAETREAERARGQVRRAARGR